MSNAGPLADAPAGPLEGVTVVEMHAIGPVPHAATLLADLGATVLRVTRPGMTPPPVDYLARGRRVVAVDLKNPAAAEVVLRLVERADVLLEGSRPGVMERLGLGPTQCTARNPALIYGRMTGWGQDGPLAHTAGHDINYLAVAGLLHGFRRAGERPVPPVNLVGDFGGGSLYLLVGVLAALLHARSTGEGQVIDAAMIDGAASLNTMSWSLAARDMWDLDAPGTNLLDTGAHFYEVYRCADGEHVALGAVEPQFYAQVLQGLGLDPEELPEQNDRSSWPAMKERFAAIFATRTREQWCETFEGLDACFAPVLSPSEALDHPHIRHRGTYVVAQDHTIPGVAPRLSRTPGAVARPPEPPTPAVLQQWGFNPDEVDDLVDRGVLGPPPASDGPTDPQGAR